MVRSEFSIVIESSPEEVFARISDPANAPQDVPGVTAVEDVSGKWSTTWYRAVSSVAGVPIQMDCEFQEYIFGRRLTVQSTGGLDGTVTWHLEPSEGRTRVRLVSECRFPAALASKVAESTFQEQMDRQWREALANVKARLEAATRDSA